MIEIIGLVALFLFLTLSTATTPRSLFASSTNVVSTECQSLPDIARVGRSQLLNHSRTELRPYRPTVTRPRARGFVFCVSRTRGEM
jgi:hypothetical protein